jgi:hypothetical protein
MRTITVLAFAFALSCATPRVTGTRIEKPLDDARVAVVSSTNPKLAARIEGLLLRDHRDLQVIARADEQQLNAEQDEQVSGRYSTETAVAIGERVGASLLLVAEEIAAEESVLEQKSRFGLRVTAIDIESGVVLGYAEADGTKEQFDLWGDCDFECLQDLATRAAVERLLGPAARR